MRRMAGEFRDLADLDRAVRAKDKRSMAALLAVRPWVFPCLRACGSLPAGADQGWRWQKGSAGSSGRGAFAQKQAILLPQAHVQPRMPSASRLGTIRASTLV
jgi:hypothetical protein